MSKFGNSLEYPLQCPPIEYVPCRNAQDLNTAAGKPLVAAEVTLRIAAHVVRQPVYLHRQPRRREIEVEHILPDGVLLAEAQPTERLAPQRAPQQDFGQGHFAPQAAGAIECFSWCSHAPSTIPLRVMVPLPRKRGRKLGLVELDPVRTFPTPSAGEEKTRPH
jgi:hypothetical protein